MIYHLKTHIELYLHYIKNTLKTNGTPNLLLMILESLLLTIKWKTN